MTFVKKLVWFLWIGVLLLCVVELFKKPGITQRVFGIQLLWLVGGAGFLMALVKNELPQKLIFIGLILTIIGMILTKIFETYFYPNFSYSHFHIFPDGFTAVSFLLVTPLVIDYLKVKDVYAILSIVILMYWAIVNLSGTLSYTSSKLVFAVKNPNATYDDKMRVEWGKFYDCMLIVKNNTPENAIIFIPPQNSVWQMEGNEALVRYFLYPRQTLHLEKIEDATKSAGDIYVLYSWGLWQGPRETDSGWPVATFSAKTGRFEQKNDDFNYEEPQPFYGNNMKINRETCGVVSFEGI